MRRFFLRLLLIAPLLVIAAGLLWLRSSLPQRDGRLVLAGLGSEVSISRDAHGIPTIRAANDRDAAFALGFVHAQDRLFQMDVMRRVGAGRLSELFGAATLPTDRFMRTLGLYRAAEREYAGLSPALRAALDAYAAGVNAYLAHRRGALPPEYYLLRAAPEPWRPADTLVWGKLMALELAGNFRRELLHARVAQHVKIAEDLQILFPSYPKDGPVTLGDGATAWLKGIDLGALSRSVPGFVGPQFDSNNWVVDGHHTISGKPLLANDPHLGLSAPSIWYLARIETPTLKLAGATSPGGPFIVLGHNARIAWGFTNTESDVEDLFIERVDPSDPTRYLTPDGSQAFVTRQEKILVRGQPTQTLTVRETRHGPVISDLGGRYGALAASGTVLALETTWLGNDDHTPDALWAMNRAGDWEQFRAALKNFVAPEQNIVYADVDGNIGFIAPGRVPIRAKGDGWLPAPGWSGDYDWTGYIPFDRMPRGYNPASGRFVSANNKIVPDSYPYFLGRGWDIPNRAERINALLDATPKQSPSASAAIQGDTLSLMAKRLLPLMLKIEPATPQARQAVDQLRRWDGRMTRDATAPLLFAAWLREFNRTIFADKLGDAFDEYWAMRPEVVELILTQHPDWCDDRSTAPVETCTQQLSASLERALAQLTERYGSDMAAWRWGKPHEAEFTNLFWMNVPVLRRLFATSLPADGGYDTVDRGNTVVSNPRDPYGDVHAPTLRMIVDLSEIDRARFIIAPGQSGNPLSPHYSDMMVPWRDLAYVTLDQPAASGTLVLAPR